MIFFVRAVRVECGEKKINGLFFIFHNQLTD